MNAKFSKMKRGFTLIETLVALSIFSTSIVVLVYLTSSGVANTTTAKNKFIASYLAQEGVEMVRNRRDNAGLADPTTAWNTFLTGVAACTASTGCVIEPRTLQINPYSATCSPTCPYLRYDNTKGFYTYDTSVPLSNFRRKIVVDTLGGSNHEVKVTVDVSWLQGSLSRSVTYSEYLLDWIK